MSDAAMARSTERYPGEMSEFDRDIIGHSAVQLRIPVQEVQETLEALRKVRLVVERAIVKLEAAPIGGKDRSVLFDVKSLLRQCAMSIGRVKRRRF